ncbi:MAG TPA: hypothetical protein PLN31_19475 [Azoarcus taiwanensis]|nr:hypothetical protein [Rhodocyclaceae bacterium]HRQ59603.1 hypothetical protein [Azoarcus taiwanensis]
MSEPVLFPFRPNWHRPVVERLEWLTDVQEALDLTEECIQLRSMPRRALEYDVLLRDHALTDFDARLWGWQAEEYWLPIWTDVQTCALVPAETSVLPAETAGYDFAAGGRAVLLRDAQSWELLDIDAVQPDALVLAAPTAQAWPAGTRLYPVRRARLPPEVGALRGSAAVGRGTVRFDLEPSTWPASPAAVLYRDLEVSLRRPNWVAGVPQQYHRKVEVLDNRTGRPYVDDLSGMPTTTRTHRVTLGNRADIAAWRGWLYARAGRRHRFWQPQWQVDRISVAPVTAAATALQVRALDHAAAYGNAEGRRDIAIRHRPSAQWLFRRIESVTGPMAGVETLHLDASLGIDAQPSELFVTWLTPSRLDADAVEIAWHSAGAAVSVYDVRSGRE